MFRFTIRELVLLTLVVAMCFGWCVDRGRLEESRDAAEAQRDRLQQRNDEYRRFAAWLDLELAERGLGVFTMGGGWSMTREP